MSNGHSSVLKALDTLLTTLGALPGLEARRQQLEKLKEQTGTTELNVGVVGITSSGKSTFLNALMGERLLPEESRATTNLLVRCRRDEVRKLIIRYQNGKSATIKGSDLTPKRLAELCSEKLNPGNHLGIAYLEWSTPNTVLPPGLVLVDTPGLDAYGCDGHETLTLRQFLPVADIVIYLSSIRNPFKQADLRLIDAIVENDQRVLFVLSQADLERDSTEAGRVIRSREQKLQNHLKRLQDDVREHTNLQAFGTELVSSRLAREGFSDKASAAWQASRFDHIISWLHRFEEQLQHLVLEGRGRRLLATLQRTEEDLQQLLNRAGGLVPVESVGEQRLHQLATARAAIIDLRAEIRRAWHGELDADARTKDLTSYFRHLDEENVSAFENGAERKKMEWDRSGRQLSERMDQAQQEMRMVLQHLGIEPDRSHAAKRAFDTTAFPDARAHAESFAKPVNVGWGFRWPPWPHTETTSGRRIRRTDFLRALEGYARATCQAWHAHLEWWDGYVTEAYLQPLQREWADEHAASEQRKAAQLASEAEQRAAQAACTTIQAMIADLRRMYEAPSPKQEPDASPEVIAHVPAAPTSGAGAGHRALVPLLAAFRETALQEEFHRFLESLNVPKGRTASVLLLGQQREGHLRLLAHLLHNQQRRDHWEGQPSTWLVCGDPIGLEIPAKPRVISPSNEVLQRVRLVIAPADPHLGRINWNRFFAKFDAVGVEVNASRIASGWSDVHNAPYARQLGGLRGRLFFTCGDGALFTSRLSHLVTQVAVAGPFGKRPWFIHEDYDARYTVLLRLMASLTFEDNQQELVRRWKAEELALDEPFTEAALRQAVADVAVWH